VSGLLSMCVKWRGIDISIIFYWNLELSHTEIYTTQIVPLTVNFHGSSDDWYLQGREQ
jgi:hypothetical protein